MNTPAHTPRHTLPSRLWSSLIGHPAGKLALLLLVAITVAAAAALLTYRQRVNAFLNEAIGGIKICALTLAEYDLSTLHAAPEDAATATYGKIKKHLQLTYKSNPDVVAVIICRHETQTRETRCLVNIHKPGEPDTLPPGSPLPADIDSSTLLGAILRKDGVAARLNHGPARGYTREASAIAARRPSPQGGTTIDIAYYQTDANARIASYLTTASARAIGLLLLVCLPMLVYLIARGNTRQKHALHEYMTALGQCGDSIVIAGPKQHYLYANQGFVRMSGYSREEILKMKGWDFWPEIPPDAEAIWATLFAPGSKPYVRERLVRRKNGQLFLARLAITPIYDKKNRIVASMHICTDLSAASKPNILLNEARRHAMEASRSKSALIATLSHEVRTPLNAIIGFADLLLDTSLPPEHAARTATIRKHGESLAHMATNILDISRLESGGARIEPRECDIASLCLEALGIAEVETDRRIRFSHDMQPDMPEILSVDAERLQRMLVNLALSAAQHIQTGEVKLTVREAPAGTFENLANTVALQFSITGARNTPAEHTPATGAPPSCESPAPILWLLLARRLAALMGCRVTADNSDSCRFTYVFSMQCAESPQPETLAHIHT